MNSIDTSGKALVGHWKWAGDKGLMNSNTASGLRAACAQVLSVLDGWETLDVRALDPSDVFRRFQNKRGKDFTPGTLAVYKRRFTQAVASFLSYAEDPTGWKAPAQDKPPKKERARVALPSNGNDDASDPAELPPPTKPGQSSLVEYPFPLRAGRFAYLRLPSDLNLVDVRRLNTFLATLALDLPEEP